MYELFIKLLSTYLAIATPFILFSSFCQVIGRSPKNSTPSGDEDIKNGKAGKRKDDFS